ncbi:MAG: ATP-binding protein [Lachnospiraceae bacterium]|nr:ATP-binding protein [Lachnospiraceae bacterium]MDY4836954.1 ATP-binding protein [Lachnospiraceae bacterium]
MLRNMDFNIASVLVTTFVFVYFITRYDTKKKSSRCFLSLLLCVFLTSVLSIVFDYLQYSTGSNYLSYIVNAFYMLLTVLCTYIFYVYASVTVFPDGRRHVLDYVNFVFLISYIILCVLSMHFHYFISITDGVISRGAAYPVVYLLSAYYLLCAFIRMLIHIKSLMLRQTHSIIFFVVTTSTGAIVQYLFFSERIIIYFSYALACLILLFTFETPDYQKMIKVTNELKRNNEQLNLYKQQADDLSKTVHKLMKTSSWFIYFDKNGEITDSSWSEEFLPLLGYSLDDNVDVANLWTDSLHPEDKDKTLEAFMNGLKGAEYKTEARLRYKDGSYHWFLCTGSLHTDSAGNPESYKGVIQNIDDEIYTRELINERLKAVEDLERSQTELERALFASEEAGRAKTTFLSNMSHDIRTPMNAILGYAQLAKEHISDKDEVLGCINTILSSGDHLLSLINDVLDMSRIESGKVKIENAPVSLLELINGIEVLTKSNVKEKHQTYETIIENLDNPYVLCDRLKLNQILINCVGNAVKYTPDGGHIKLMLTQKDTEFVFKIIDDGIGMSADLLAHVFEPFVRAGNTDSIQGTGLGMAITYNLVNMMGGTISAESKLKAGSTFTISLPLQIISKEEYSSFKEAPTDEISVDEMVTTLSGKRFLVVDDNKINRSVVRRLLSDRGMYVDECERGRDAINIISSVKEGTYDAVFMDIIMPEMTGYESTTAIRNLDSAFAKTIPIFAMTANAFEEDIKKANECGMNGHITKPFKIEDLIRFLYHNLS